MLLENLAIGRTVEINVDREDYCYHLVSKIEQRNSKRLCVSLIVSGNRFFKFRDGDKIRIIYRSTDQIWEWDNVKAGVGKLENTPVHYFDIQDGGKSFNRRNAYRVLIEEDVMLGYFDQYGTTAKSSEMQKFKLSDEASAPPGIMVPKFVKGYVKDLSETGVGICSNYEFSIDDAMFFNIQSDYGKLTMRAQVVRKAAMSLARNKYSNYYGCILLQTDSRLSRYIYDLQREAIKLQKQKEDDEELRKDMRNLERGILSSKKLQQEASKVKGIRTVADEAKRENLQLKPHPKVEGIRTADEVEKLKEKVQNRPRPKVEGIKTADEVEELKEKAKLKPRLKVEGIKTAEDVEKIKQKKNTPAPQIEGIKTAGLK